MGLAAGQEGRIGELPVIESPEAMVCGTLVADIRVQPFVPIGPWARARVRRVESIRMLPGGIVANTGLALARLGIKTGLIGRLGHDAIGDVLLAAFRDAGLGVEHLRRMPDVPTAPVIVCVDPAGERTSHYAEGASTLFDRGDLEVALPSLRQARAIVIGYLNELPHLDPELVETLAWLKRESGALVVLETAGPQELQHAALLEVLKSVDVFVPSWVEARDLTDARTPHAALTRIVALAPSGTLLGIKLGAAGCLARLGGRICRIPAYPSVVRDATGAGDSFLAGVVAGLLRGCDPATAIRLGNMAGALTVAAIEGHAALPPFEELLGRVAEHNYTVAREKRTV